MLKQPKLTKSILALVVAASLAGCGKGDSSSSTSTAASVAPGDKGEIRVNQLGYLPSANKIAVVPATSATRFNVVKAGSSTPVLSGDLSQPATWAPAEESVKLADFSALKEPGDYQLQIEGLATSYNFTLAGDAYKSLNAAAIKSFYFNRASTEIPATYGGEFARAAGHPDDHVLVHASAAGAKRPEGTVISAPKGWYDAGDYNKYIVNSGISTYTLLAAYEHFPDYYKAQNLNIPESGDAVPDILNEAMWNIEWMLAMQDPNDGGVYHKLTDKAFDGFIMPSEAHGQRYVVQKGTAATLDFAAVMAAASRIYAGYESSYPGLSAKMLAAAKSAWAWAQANPKATYQQPADIKTGGYGDDNLSDELGWAAAELYITTGDDAYYRALQPEKIPNAVPGWPDVRGLVWMSLAQHRQHLTAAADQQLITSRIEGLANDLLSKWQSSAWATSMQKEDFAWGSNSTAANQAMMLIQAYRLDGNRKYLAAAQSQLDYLLGRNPVGYSFVTGFGDKPAMHPHHRISEADGVAAPVPGMLVGGANPGQQDKSGCKIAYPSNIAAKSYLDDVCSYASNEIAINWTAPLVYVSGALQVLTEQ